MSDSHPPAEPDGVEPDSTGSNPRGSTGETTLEELSARVDALSTQLDAVRDDLATERDHRQQLEAELKQRDDRIDELEAELADLDARTDLLRLVETSDDTSGEQRAAALIQHLYGAATTRADRGDDPAAAVTRDEAEAALHYPDVDRTTIYRDMERAARLVDGEVVEYSDGELTLDLEAAGDVPTRFTGDAEVRDL